MSKANNQRRRAILTSAWTPQKGKKTPGKTAILLTFYAQSLLLMDGMDRYSIIVNRCSRAEFVALSGEFSRNFIAAITVFQFLTAGQGIRSESDAWLPSLSARFFIIIIYPSVCPNCNFLAASGRLLFGALQTFFLGGPQIICSGWTRQTGAKLRKSSKPSTRCL